MYDHRNDPRRPRLRLEGDGLCFPLHSGENSLGSASRHDVVLRGRGVSRDHAIVVVKSGAVTIRDLGSKNGVLVNGAAVSTSPLRVGDALQLGTVRLILVAVDLDDSLLAITLPARVLPTEGTRTQATSLLPDRRWVDPEQQLDLIDQFFAAVSDAETPRLEEALRVLAESLGVAGTFLLRAQPGTGPTVMAAVGEMAEAAAEVARQWPTHERALAGHVLATETCVGVVAHARSSELGLFIQGRPADEVDPVPLLVTLLRMVERFIVADAAVVSGRSAGAWQRQQHLPEQPLPEGIVPSTSPAMCALYDQARLLRQGNAPALILGESGVGKEHIARLIHDASGRSTGPFVAINCAAIPQELLEAELFGIGRGVATGVVSRQGKLQAADGGTLFLDEIGDMTPALQAKLLRAIQEQEIVPLGRDPVKIDIRLVAATNADLGQRMAEGSFRRDLYYRLAGHVLEVPPLRARREDLPALICHFVRCYGAETGKAIRGVSVKALEQFSTYQWPGNIRELDNLVRRVVYACPDGQAIESTHLPPELSHATPPAASLSLGTTLLPDHLEAEERRWIRQALDTVHGNQTRAAKLLGVSRNGLAYRLKRLDMTTDS